MKTLIADDHEAARLAALEPGADTLIILPMEPQPTTKICSRGRIPTIVRGWFDPGIEITEKDAPYAPGDRIGVREAWLLSAFWGCDTDDVYVCYRCENSDYRPDSPRHIGHSVRKRSPESAALAVAMHERHKKQVLQHPRRLYRWRAAHTMPQWAIRTHLLVHRVEARVVGTITEDECRAAGVCRGGWEYDDGECCATNAEAFANKWHRRHPDLPFETWAWFTWATLDEPLNQLSQRFVDGKEAE